MQLCTFCPKGTKCNGYILHTFILKLFNAIGTSESSDELIKVLSRDDLLVLANKGAESRVECWRMSFVLSVVAKIEEIALTDRSDDTLREDAEELIVRMGQLFSKLPKGNAINIPDLVMDIYNQLCENINEKGLQLVIPVSVISHACMAASRRA
ncbi:MAG: hypothetical protein NUV50_10460 [Rhodospirillales bacterium]|nr:hypothetical protein [Rhodospirillales bacterium]